MLNKYCPYIFLFFSTILVGLDLNSICQSSEIPTAFTTVIRTNFPELKQVKIEKIKCLELRRPIDELAHVYLTDSSEVPFLPLFEKLDSLTLDFEKKPVRDLKLGALPNLIDLHIMGDVQISDLKELFSSPKLGIIWVLGRGIKTSFIDIKQISQFPIKSITLANIAVRNSSSLGDLKDLQTIILKTVKLDQPVNWKGLPNLKVKTIKE